MRIAQSQLNEIIEKGSKISCESCHCKTFKMFSARIDDEGSLSSGKSEYFTSPVVVTLCLCCGHSWFELGEKTLPDYVTNEKERETLSVIGLMQKEIGARNAFRKEKALERTHKPLEAK